MDSKLSMANYTITTLGCKVNQCESASMAKDFEKLGFSELSQSDKTEPEYCIINTCTVTQKASMQSRQEIRKAIRAYPNARIIVTGCYAQTEPDEIRKIDGVHHVVGHIDKKNIPETIVKAPLNGCSESCKKKPLSIDSRKRTRSFFKIQDGCNAFCTYCIVPYARGRSRSLSPDEVFAGLKGLKNSGYKETVLTGIHLGVYGDDLVPKTSLYKLLKQIEKFHFLKRIRLSSIEPCELSGNIIKLVSKSDIFCNHFHIPLQSGDNKILEKMHRPYDRRLIKELISKIDQLIPEAAVGSDFLIGFPGEDDNAFANTCSLIKKLPITHLHIFPFSRRKGTRAAEYPDQVDPKIIKARCKKVREIGIRKTNEFYEKFIGKDVEILVEGKKISAGFLQGTTSNYIPVVIKGSDDLINTFVQAEIYDLGKNGLPHAKILSCS